MVGVNVAVGVNVTVGVGVSVEVPVAVMLAVCVGIAVGRGAKAEQADSRARRNNLQETRNKGCSLFIVKERGIYPMITEKARHDDVPSYFSLLASHSLFSPLINASVFSRQILSLNCLGGVLKK